MTEMGHDRRKDRLKGPAIAVTSHFKDEVRKWCKREGVSLTELGKRVGLSQSAMSRLFSGKQPTSRAARAISKETGVPLHERAAGDDEEAKWLELGARLKREKPEEYSRLLLFLESVAKRRP